MQNRQPTPPQSFTFNTHNQNITNNIQNTWTEINNIINNPTPDSFPYIVINLPPANQPLTDTQREDIVIPYDSIPPWIRDGGSSGGGAGNNDPGNQQPTTPPQATTPPGGITTPPGNNQGLPGGIPSNITITHIFQSPLRQYIEHTHSGNIGITIGGVGSDDGSGGAGGADSTTPPPTTEPTAPPITSPPTGEGTSPPGYGYGYGYGDSDGYPGDGDNQDDHFTEAMNLFAGIFNSIYEMVTERTGIQSIIGFYAAIFSFIPEDVRNDFIAIVSFGLISLVAVSVFRFILGRV